MNKGYFYNLSTLWAKTRWRKFICAIVNLNKGYMLSFNFNFNKNKQTGVKEVVFDNKIIIEAVV